MLRMNPIIVNYRTPDLTLKCVDSIVRMAVAEAADIVVVENGSADDSYALLKAGLPNNVQLVAAERNAGFAAGVNTGAALADHELILVLNPDTYFVDNSISKAVDLFVADSSIGLVGLDLTYPNGERQLSARRFYCVLDIVARRSPLGRYWPLRQMVERHLMRKAWEKGKAFAADWVMGTGFIIRRALFEEIGRMDDAYFLYMEDVDLCARVWRHGRRVVCVPGARLIHDHQRSSRAGPLSSAGKMHIRSLRIFRQKYRIPFFSPPGVEGVFRR